MSGKLDKFKDIFAMVEPLAEPFVPGAAGSVLHKVNAALGNSGIQGAIPDAVKAVAAVNDEQTEAILALSQAFTALKAENADLKARVAALEAK